MAAPISSLFSRLTHVTFHPILFSGSHNLATNTLSGTVKTNLYTRVSWGFGSISAFCGIYFSRADKEIYFLKTRIRLQTESIDKLSVDNAACASSLSNSQQHEIYCQKLLRQYAESANAVQK